MFRREDVVECVYSSPGGQVNAGSLYEVLDVKHKLGGKFIRIKGEMGKPLWLGHFRFKFHRGWS